MARPATSSLETSNKKPSGIDFQLTGRDKPTSWKVGLVARAGLPSFNIQDRVESDL